MSAGEYLKEATSGGSRNKKLIVCWDGLIMNQEHVDLLELSTLRSALKSVVEEIPDDKLERGGAMKMVNKPQLGIWVDFRSVKETDFPLW